MILEILQQLPLATFAYTAIATVAVSVISAGVSYYGAQQQAKAQQKASYFNSLQLQYQAEEQRRVAAENARRKRREDRRRKAAMRARHGGSGLAFDGSALDSLAESASILERETGDMFRRQLAGAAAYDQQAAMTVFEGGLMADAQRTAATANLVSDVASAAAGGYKTYKGV